MAVSEKKIKRRIRSAKNISQITRAMQMVAASKLRRAQEKALAGKPYALEILRLVREARAQVSEDAHPLLKEKGEGEEKLVILVSTNKGLCGSLNSDLFRKVDEWFPKDAKTSFVTLGTKGEAFVVRSGRPLVADFSQNGFLDNVPALSRMVIEGFLAGTYAEVWVSYTEFISALKDRPSRVKLLPFTRQPEMQEEEAEEEKTGQDETEILVEPSYDAVLETLLPHVIEIEIRTAIIESEAAEHAARMLAMKNATDNANELIEGLTLVANKIRQEAITNEIADMVTARMAVS